MEDLKYKGYTIKVIQDEDPMNPRVENDNLGTMVCFHPNYVLGDPSKGRNAHGFTKESLLEHIQRDDVVKLPLYLYDHSGLAMSTGRFAGDAAGWDTSLVGFIFLSLEKARKELGNEVTRERIEEILRAEVAEYDDYLQGNVYGYKVIDKDGDEVGSCWGFIGDPGESGLLDDAKAEIDADLVRNPEQLSLFPELEEADNG